MGILPDPISIFQSSLRIVDYGLEQTSLAADAITRSRAALPPVTSDFNENERESFISQTIGVIRDQIQRGLPVASLPLDTIKALLDAFAVSKKWEEGLDDRKLFLDYVFVFLSRAPPSEAVKELEHSAIALLYRDLPHPPSTYVGPQNQFRSWDGSGNSATVPDMGRSFTPYSRSCASTRPLPITELPDAGLVFDTLIRRDKFVPHPAGLSGLFFNWATAVIHSVFRSSRTNPNINQTSSYIDLGIVYGNTKYHADRMRIVDGRGKIIPDSFGESRIGNLLGAAAIVVLFNRNHNWICDRLLAINERNTWTSDLVALKADTKDVYTNENYKNTLEKQDYEIFQTARLINSLTYANVMLSDFMAGILGTQGDGSSWSLDITSEHREANHSFLERGGGNSCSVEFNILYRLHHSMSEDDEKHIENTFRYIFSTNDWDSVAPESFEFRLSNFGRVAVAKATGTPYNPPTDDEYRELSEVAKNNVRDDGQPLDYSRATLGQFARDPVTKKFKDSDLAGILHKATSAPAAALKARGVPHVMRVIEILGIEQSRFWGACTLNEFRHFLGLRPYTTFEEWNPDKAIAEAARKLYRHPDNLELYVGLVAEEAKTVGSGGGLCSSFTMARAILADIVSIVRGDRHLTYDATPYNLTAWGFTEGNRNTENASFGGVLGKLFNRCLPQYFPATSVWTHFPLVTPTGQPFSMDNILKNLGKHDDYTFERPQKEGTVVVVPSVGFHNLQMTGYSNFGLRSPYTQNISEVKLDRSFLGVIDDPINYAKITAFIQNTFVPAETLSATKTWFHDRTLELIREKKLDIYSFKAQSHVIDLVKDVFRLVPVHWASTKVAGLPLKTSYETRGIYYEQQMYQMLKEIYSYIYQDGDQTMKIADRSEARENVKRLSRFVKLSLIEAKGGLPGSVLGSFASLVIGDTQSSSSTTLNRLLHVKAPIDEIAADVVAFISTASVELSQIFTHVVNFYLAPTPPNVFDKDYVAASDVYKKKIANEEKIRNIVANPTADAASLLEGYVREALRHDPVTPGIFRVATSNQDTGYLKWNKGDKLFFDYRAAGAEFPVPDDQDPNFYVDPTTPVNQYANIQGDGVFKVLGQEFVYGVAASVLQAVFSLPNLHRAKGHTGTLRRFKDVISAPNDTVVAGKKKIPKIRLGDDGKPIVNYDKEGNIVKPDLEEIADYSWQAGEGLTAWKYTYTNPEDGHRETPWATGFTINFGHYSPESCVKHIAA